MQRVAFKTPNVDSVLAIDAATRTGWAMLDTDGSIMSGHESFKADSHGRTLRMYSAWLAETVNELRPALVAYEVPQIGLANRVSGNASRLLLGGFYGVTMSFLYALGLACLELSPADVKKAVTGKGNAGKSEVMAAVRNLGHDVDNADQADAVAILLTSIRQMGGRRAA